MYFTGANQCFQINSKIVNKLIKNDLELPIMWATTRKHEDVPTDDDIRIMKDLKGKNFSSEDDGNYPIQGK
jgi:hypothetical protein